MKDSNLHIKIKIILAIIYIVSFISCKETTRKEKKQIIWKSKTIKKFNFQKDSSFINRIKSLPIQKLPYEFNKCNTGSLDNLEKSENLHKALRINTDKLVSLNQKKTLLFIH